MHPLGSSPTVRCYTADSTMQLARALSVVPVASAKPQVVENSPRELTPMRCWSAHCDSGDYNAALTGYATVHRAAARAVNCPGIRDHGSADSAVS
jgi:hypothetical protein